MRERLGQLTLEVEEEGHEPRMWQLLGARKDEEMDSP
jgi:hypothetical protein